MSSVSNVTSQLNNIGGCNSSNCCDQISALTARISSLESKVSQAQSTASKADGTANEALGKIIASSAAIGVLGAQFGGLSAEIAAVAGTIAALGARIAAVAGTVAAVAGEVAAATAGIAAIFAELAPIIIAVAAIAGIAVIANKALSTANEAERTATGALDIASAASRLADAGYSASSDAIRSATQAIAKATHADELAENANRTSGKALTLGGTAIEGVQGVNSKIDRLAATVSALPTSVAEVRSIAAGASTTADRAIAIAGSKTNGRDGSNGRDGTPGIAGATGLTGAPGRDGAPGRAGTPGVTGATGAAATPATNTNTKSDVVNSGKEDEIIASIAKLGAQVLAIPTSIANSQTFRAAATSAAAAGSCQSSRPGGCNGGSADQISKLEGLLGGLGTAYGAVNNALLNAMNTTLNLVNTKLGSQITGGLSKWTQNLAEIANRSQILNIFTWIGVMHNAYFLSNSLTQTLFSAVSNSLAALGIKDTSTNPAGTAFDVGKLVGEWTDAYFKSIFGVAQVEGMKAEWKKYSRIYQAAAQVMYSVQSIGQSMLGALEVVGSHVAKIGNAMQKFRIVGEKAYSWMNPQPGFQNRFFTVLQGTQEVVSQIDNVASQVLSTQESIAQMQKNKDDLVKSMSEDPKAIKADAVPEAAKTKAAEDASKNASKSPAIPESAQVKP
jgi:Collagen triple helix repeat (20 copies)